MSTTRFTNSLFKKVTLKEAKRRQAQVKLEQEAAAKMEPSVDPQSPSMSLLSTVDLTLMEDENIHYHIDPFTQFYNQCHSPEDGKFCSDKGAPVSGKTVIGDQVVKRGPKGGSLRDPHEGTDSFGGVRGYGKDGKPVPGTDAYLESHNITREIWDQRPYVRFEADKKDPALMEAYSGDKYERARVFFARRAEQGEQSGGYIMYKHEVPGTPHGEIAPQARPNVEMVPNQAKRSKAEKILANEKERLVTLKDVRPDQLVDEYKAKLERTHLELKRIKKATPKIIRDEADNNVAEAAENLKAVRQSTKDPLEIKEAQKALNSAKIQQVREYKRTAGPDHPDMEGNTKDRWHPDKEIEDATKRIEYAENRLKRTIENPAAEHAKELVRQVKVIERAEKRYKDTAAKYLFPPKTDVARVDIHPDAQNTKNLVEGKGRIYFAMEGSIKNDAILTAIKREDPTAAVVNIPSVTLWQQKGLAPGDLTDVAWVATNYGKDREIILIPDSDGVYNSNVNMQSEALAGLLNNGGAKTVIVAYPPLKFGTRKKVEHFNLPSGTDEERKGIDDHLGAGRGTLGQLHYRSYAAIPSYDLSAHLSANGATGKDKINSNGLPAAEKLLGAISRMAGTEGIARISAKTMTQAAGLVNDEGEIKKTTGTGARRTLERIGAIKVEYVYDPQAASRGRLIPKMSGDRLDDLVRSKVIPQPRTDRETTEKDTEQSPIITINKKYRIKVEDERTGTLSNLESWDPPETFKGWTSSITGKKDKTGMATRLERERLATSAKRRALGKGEGETKAPKKAPPGRKLVRTAEGAKRYGVPLGHVIPLSLEQVTSMTLLSTGSPDIIGEMRTCTIEGCNEPHKGLGFCGRHYNSFKTYGDPFATMTNLEWLFNQISTDMGEECQEWPFGILKGDGYGVVKYKGNTRRVQRVAFELLFGSVSDDLVVTNTCNNILCFNPNHLQEEPYSRTSRCAKKTHCINGHPFDEEHSVVLSSGERVCVPCRREKEKRFNQSHPEASRLKRWNRKGKGVITQAELTSCLEEFEYKCVYCGDDWQHIDHWIPLSRGGLNVVDNIVPACGPCNDKKWAHHPIEFVTGTDLWWFDEPEITPHLSLLSRPIPLAIEDLTSMVLLSSIVDEEELVEFYNKCHGEDGRFCEGDTGERVSGKITVRGSPKDRNNIVNEYYNVENTYSWLADQSRRGEIGPKTSDALYDGYVDRLDDLQKRIDVMGGSSRPLTPMEKPVFSEDRWPNPSLVEWYASRVKPPKRTREQETTEDVYHHPESRVIRPRRFGKEETSTKNLTSMVLLSSIMSEDELVELYNKCHGEDGRFCGEGDGGNVSGRFGSVTQVARASKGRGSVKVGNIKAKAVYEITDGNGVKLRLYDKTGKAEPYAKSMLESQAEMSELYPMKPPRDIVVAKSASLFRKSEVDKKTFAIVWSNDNNTYVNSDMLGIDVSKYRDGFQMPSAKSVGDTRNMDYLLTHEYGHHVDFDRHAKSSGYEVHPLYKVELFKAALSDYGQSDDRGIEGYAEAFAEWHHSGGKTRNPTAIAMARYEGWVGGKGALTAGGIVHQDLIHFAKGVEEFLEDSDEDINADLPDLSKVEKGVIVVIEGSKALGDFVTIDPSASDILKARRIMDEVIKELEGGEGK